MTEKRKNLTREEVQAHVRTEMERENNILRDRGIKYAHAVLRKMSRGQFKIVSVTYYRRFMELDDEKAAAYKKGIRVHLFFTRDFDNAALSQAIVEAGYDPPFIEGDIGWFGCNVTIPVPTPDDAEHATEAR